MGRSLDLYSEFSSSGAFPFPVADEAAAARIRDLGERLDAHRKAPQELYLELTLTNLYNVLEKVSLGDRLLAGRGLVGAGEPGDVG